MALSPANVLLTEDDLKSELGGQGVDPDKVKRATDAAIAFVLRRKADPTKLDPPETWAADFKLGALRLAVGLYRDALKPGVAEPFAQGNVYARATDVQIEQLLQIGRFALPVVG
ncbi:hypothetical protein [Leifsonia aquatica]|uniref:hypothetical protein n=1 Tax=Leifsonia aquatica TaxID=144185 RepID=UPI003827F54F